MNNEFGTPENPILITKDNLDGYFDLFQDALDSQVPDELWYKLLDFELGIVRTIRGSCQRYRRMWE